MADQVINSGNNLLVGLLAGRLLLPDDAGKVVVALSVVYLAVGLQRAVVGEPLLAHVSTLSCERRRTVAHDGLIFAFLLGVGVGVLGAAAYSLGIELASCLLWLAPWIPFAVFQDAGRYLALAERRPAGALSSDAAWALSSISFLCIIWALGTFSAQLLLLAWGFGAVAGSAVIYAQCGAGLTAGRPNNWFKEVGSLSTWFAAQVLLANVQNQVVLILLGSMLGSASAAGLRVVQLIYQQPIQTLLVAVNGILTPSVAALRSEGSTRKVRGLMRRSMLFATVAVVFLVCFASIRSVVLPAIFPAFSDYISVVVPVAGTTALFALQAPLTASLIGLKRGGWVLSAQIVWTTATVIGVAIGATLGDTAGAGWGLFAGAVAFVSVSVFAFLRCTRDD